MILIEAVVAVSSSKQIFSKRVLVVALLVVGAVVQSQSVVVVGCCRTQNHKLPKHQGRFLKSVSPRRVLSEDPPTKKIRG